MLRLAPIASRLDEARRHLSDPCHGKLRLHLAQWADQCASDSRAGLRWTSSQDYLCLESGGALTIDGGGEPWTLDPMCVSLSVGRFAQEAAGIRWVGSMMPVLPEAWAAVAIRTVRGGCGRGDPALLDRYFDSNVPMGNHSHFLLALVLNDSRPAVHTVGVDLAIATIDDRRLDPDCIGRAVGELTGTGCVAPPRWARTFRDVAGSSALHRDVVIGILETAVAIARPKAPQDMLGMLELLETLLLEAQRPLANPDTRAALDLIKGSSKTARAASRLLALEEQSSS